MTDTTRLVYEVHVEIDADKAADFATYMQTKHLPEILDTGCFVAIEFECIAGNHFRSRYIARTREDIDRYLEEFTAAFRDDFARHFPNGVKVWREIWEQLQTFSAYNN